MAPSAGKTTTHGFTLPFSDHRVNGGVRRAKMPHRQAARMVREPWAGYANLQNVPEQSTPPDPRVRPNGALDGTARPCRSPVGPRGERETQETTPTRPTETVTPAGLLGKELWTTDPVSPRVSRSLNPNDLFEIPLAPRELRAGLCRVGVVLRSASPPGTLPSEKRQRTQRDVRGLLAVRIRTCGRERHCGNMPGCDPAAS